jgi:hypothetical protein
MSYKSTTSPVGKRTLRKGMKPMEPPLDSAPVVRLRHNHAVRGRVVAVTTVPGRLSRVTFENGGTYPSDAVETVAPFARVLEQFAQDVRDALEEAAARGRINAKKHST